MDSAHGLLRIPLGNPGLWAYDFSKAVEKIIGRRSEFIPVHGAVYYFIRRILVKLFSGAWNLALNEFYAGIFCI